MLKSIFALSLGLIVGGFAQAQDTGTSYSELPRVISAPIRIAPVFGASSFATSSKLQTDNFGDNFSAGVLADFGSGTWAFETGILTLQSNADSSGNSASVNIDTLGIPLFAKWNMSGRPNETVFLKAGAMPFTANGDSTDSFDVMAVGGVGGAIPLGRSSALILDAAYNRLITTGGDLTDYQGISLLAGLSFNL